HIMALGDDYNDIPMLQKAGYSVAMENAVPEVKAAARYITDTNNNDGVAKAIKRYVFGIES
ncbi:MAG: HAD hydrolase family protein, partial [Spirochaetales bacterium]|nr:HAD hydrolase family protein [Spirochaetales bacterium]